MQEQIIVKPTYTGPRLLEVYLKKSKGHSSLGRMISTYNKRFFVLDMNRVMFYYLPEKDAVLGGATEIPLDSINRIYVEHKPQLGQQDQTSKGFVILTKKKAYKLLCDSQLIMEQLLFAFSNLIGAQSQKPLYDWNTYNTSEAQESVSPVANKRSASKEPTFNKTEYQSTMHQRRGSNVNNRSPVRGAYLSQGSQEYQNPNPVSQKETVIKSQPREMNIVEEKKSLPKVESSNLEPEQPLQQQQQISPKNEEDESKTVQENEVERSSSPSQQEKERRSPSKENQQGRGRTMGLNLNQVPNSEHMVEVQSLDVPSKSNSDEAKNIPALSSRQLQSFRRSSASRQKAGGMTPTDIPVGRIENFNSVPVKIDHNKITKLSGDATTETRKAVRNEDTYMSKSDPVSSLSRKAHPREAEGYAFSPVEEKRAEVVDGDMPLSYLDIMKLKKKSNPQYQSEVSIPSSKYEVNKRQVEVEEDWDNDLFGDGKLSPIKTQKKLDNNYNSQYISQPNQSSAQISKLTGFNERKAETATGKTETFAVRGYVHNDWDDDL
jgi:hypothetical protein